MFDKIKVSSLPDYQGEGVLYRHQETGFEVFQIKNTDSELTFNFIFRTPSEDSTGVAHIIEHTVLNGSKKYPVKDPFSQALQSSPNTFMNAMTFCDKTMYPVSSPLKKDFDNLFSLYADAVFAPLLRKESFLQEGIRVSEGHFDGVVFNEMRGYMSTEDAFVQSNATKALFNGTGYEYESGGDPLYIPDLTYEKYLERYKKWYHPGNCRLFLFGNLNAQEYMEKLEENYLKGLGKFRFEEGIMPISEVYEAKDSKPLQSKAFCPNLDAHSVVLTWLTKRSDNPLELITLSVLTDILLGNPGAPLYKAITDSALGEDLSPTSGMDAEFPVMPFTVGFTGVKTKEPKEIESFLLKTLETLVNEGLPEEAVNAAIKRQEFKLQEIPGGLPFGFKTSLRAARTWLRGGDPAIGCKTSEPLKALKEQVEKGRYFEEWIRENLLDNPRRCLLEVSGDKDYEAKLEGALQAKIGLCPPFDQQRFESFTKAQDSAEDLAKIGRINRSDLPNNVPVYSQEAEEVLQAQIVKFPLFTNGIVYCCLGFDLTGLSLEEKKMVPLLIRLMQMCGAGNKDYVEMANLIRYLTGSFMIYNSSGTDVNGQAQSKLIVKFKMLQSDVEKAMDLVSFLLREGNFSEEGRIQGALTDLLTDFESNYLDSANAFATLNACSEFSPVLLENELSIGTLSWLYLKDLNKSFASSEGLSVELTNLRNKIFVRNKMIFHLGCDASVMDKNEISARKFITDFPQEEIIRQANYYKIVFQPKTLHRIYNASTGPAFNAMAIKFKKDSEKGLVSKILLSSVLSSGYLWENIRAQSGAYGTESHVDGMENLFLFSSYRDPNTDKTFKTFEKAFSAKINPGEFEYAVVGIIGKELKPISPQAKCTEAFRRFVYSMTDKLYLERREATLSLTVADLKTSAEELLEECKRLNVKVTVCGEKMAKGLKLPV